MSRTRVLVIDDSAYNRRVLRRMLESEPAIDVLDAARDGEDGLKKALDLAPDVITLDLEMPKMDGFTFLRLLMSRRPTPVIVVSGRVDDQNTFLAMELGAVDFVAKPQNQISPELYDIAGDLVRKVLAARSVSLDRLSALAQRKAPAIRIEPRPAATPARRDGTVVVVGSSTGGPTALQTLLSGFPESCPVPFLISQHMPPGFTKAFAERLNKTCALKVTEAAQNQELKAGHVLITPGGYHARLAGPRESARIRLERAVGGDMYVPSVDRLFESAAEVFGPATVGVLLTGMGDDGKKGSLAIKGKGGQAVAESEDTAVVFGMPREADRAGAIDLLAPIERLATEIMARCKASPTSFGRA